MDPLIGLAELGHKALRVNTAPMRRTLCGTPRGARDWTFETYPGEVAARVMVENWWDTSTPPGLVLYGQPGVGKTGLAISCCHAAADQAVGALALWNLLSMPSVTNDSPASPRPAPVWFESWATLRGRLQRTWKRTRRDEYELDEEGLVEELETRVSVLALDDIDIDTLSDWKEMLLLRFVRRLEAGGQRVIWTTNATPSQFLARFGERMADRLLSPRLFTLVAVEGATLR